MRVKVYGGLHQGRVLVLPEGTRQGDYVELPETLPAGEMFGSSRSRPGEHTNERMYQVAESTGGDKYLRYAGPMRFVRTVDVPPPAMIPVTVHLR